MTPMERFEANQKFVHWCLVRFRAAARWMPEEEALAVIQGALWTACIQFDEKRGFAFTTFAYSVIKHAVIDASLQRGPIRVPHSVFLERAPEYLKVLAKKALTPRRDGPTYKLKFTCHDGPPDEFQELERMVFRLLTPRSAMVVRRYVLEGATLRQLAAEMGLCKERVRQILNKALQRVRESLKPEMEP